ncbi:hypothetical protein BCR34DRAFT_574547 [Clohesyomyces aquaticus]|uniref:Uncharacterized protein n=1 Tax=Clohesyomyces aquaticus TaxID=1231657 RepID=A0A1Y1YV31_9PLEO|nr:hypothetical protein BCR34DRAFT_574547 [Clohesyomyces aquaticus]
MDTMHPAFQLQRSANKDTAQNAAGHDQFQWDRFYTFTLQEARDVFKQDPTLSWTHVTAPEKRAIYERVNAKLRHEDIPEVSHDILTWRMSLVLKNLRTQDRRDQAASSSRAQLEAQSAGADLSPVSSSETQSFGAERNT